MSSFNLVTPFCPDCDEGDTLTEVVEELARVTNTCQLYDTGDVVEVEEVDREVVEVDRDSALLTCDNCGYQTDDPSEFLPINP